MNVPPLLQMLRGFIGLTTFCAFAASYGQPATAETKKVTPAIPPEVRAQMKAGIRSLGVLHLPAKKGTPPLLVHAWVEDSPVLASARVPSEDDKRWFHLDFFYLKNSKWQLSLPISYLSGRAGPPFDSAAWGSYQWRWLDTKNKEGLVVVAKVNHGIEGSIWVVTLPQGVPLTPPDDEPSYDIRRFYESYAGGNSTAFITFGAEADGKLAIVSDSGSPAGHERIIYGWRGQGWEEIRSYSNYAKIQKERQRVRSQQK